MVEKTRKKFILNPPNQRNVSNEPVGDSHKKLKKTVTEWGGAKYIAKHGRADADKSGS